MKRKKALVIEDKQIVLDSVEKIFSKQITKGKKEVRNNA